MATVLVSRQTVDKDTNQLTWTLFEVDEKDLLEGEAPYAE